jgi:hypothetical protein
MGKLSLMTRRHDSIFVIVDTLTKSSHFVHVRTMHQAPSIARVCINKILRLPDVPKESYQINEIGVCKTFWTSFPRGLGNTTEP